MYDTSNGPRMEGGEVPLDPTEVTLGDGGRTLGRKEVLH